MSSIAFLVGNANYNAQSALPCCISDVLAIEELLKATGRYAAIKTLTDVNATTFKNDLRSFLATHSRLDELYFYFSGHGCQINGEFFFCATNFDEKRPNETGLSNRELHDLLRPASPERVIKVIDACNAGSSLIKSNGRFLPYPKGELKFIYQFASCLDDQYSLAGDPLSEFTYNFIKASSKNLDSPTYYTDIASTLRDDYLEIESRTPHFITQATGRDIFVEDPQLLESVRASVLTKWAPIHLNMDNSLLNNTNMEGEQIEPRSALQRLIAAERESVKLEGMNKFIGNLFGALKERMCIENINDFFDVSINERDEYYEETSLGFIMRVLHRENRPDGFVTIDPIEREKKETLLNGIMNNVLSAQVMSDDEFIYKYNLNLHCELDQVQLTVVFSPKFLRLQQYVLVVSCAPSIHNCFIFERVTRRKRINFEDFEPDGQQVTRRWYKALWQESPQLIVEKICSKLREEIEEHIENSATIGE